jgi:hypothetical protein
MIAIVLAACGDRAGSTSLFEKKRVCAEAGWSYYERYKRQRANRIGVVLPVFAYNSELDTCLCMIGDNVRDLPEGRPPILHRAIVDLYAARTLTEFSEPETPAAFKTEFKRLMGYDYPDLDLDADPYYSQ